MNLGSTHSSPSLNQRNRTISGTTGNTPISSTPTSAPWLARQGQSRWETGRVPPAPTSSYPRGSCRPRWLPAILQPWSKQMANACLHCPHTAPRLLYKARVPPLHIRIRLFLCRNVERARVTSTPSYIPLKAHVSEDVSSHMCLM